MKFLIGRIFVFLQGCGIQANPTHYITQCIEVHTDICSLNWNLSNCSYLPIIRFNFVFTIILLIIHKHDIEITRMKTEDKYTDIFNI